MKQSPRACEQRQLYQCAYRFSAKLVYLKIEKRRKMLTSQIWLNSWE
jgi:hypothetical protein